MPSTTTNLGLYKKNPSTDGNDTFDINTMLNDNWDRIDAQVGGQLGNSSPTAVNLVNGLQVVNVPRSAPLENLRITGRTLVNLLGRDGNCEDVGRWEQYFGATLSLDSANQKYGSNAIKFTCTSASNPTGFFKDITNLITPGKYYVVVGEFKNGNVNTGVGLQVNYNGNLLQSTPNTTASYQSKALKFQAPATGLSYIYAYGAHGTPVGQYGYADGFRIYEVTSVEYTALGSMTDAQISVKYPYVDDVKHVTAPYAIKYGENLLPPFNEWIDAPYFPPTSVKNFIEPYKLQVVVTDTSSESMCYIEVPVKFGETYTFSNGSGCIYRLSQMDATSTVVAPRLIVTSGQTVSLTIVPSAVALRIHATNTTANGTIPDFSNTSAGTFTFTNPMLNLGTTAKPFKPVNDNMLAFPSVQLASSADGSVYDSLIKNDGKYYIEKRFKDWVLDGNLPWSWNNNYLGFKRVIISMANYPAAVASASAYNQIMTKFDGKVLKWDGAGNNTADTFVLDPVGGGGFLYVLVGNMDSGWGESYVPSAAEVQAYFHGWTMYTSNDPTGNTPYNKSGTKLWRYNTVLGGAGSTGTLPTTAANGWKPYKLTYQLAKPTFEGVQSEGGMTLHEGLNQIEVGQGIVIREKVVPDIVSGISVELNQFTLSPLKKRTNRILAVYRNGRFDPAWQISSNNTTAYWYGGGAATIANISNYDPTATYEVSYIALDQYLLSAQLQAVRGETGSNLKTVVDTLSMNQADQEARISANEILARQIYNVPQKTSANVTLYVDGTNGADNNDGNAGRPFKTIMKAVNSIPQVVNHTVTINVAFGTYNETVNVNGFTGSGGITLQGDNTISLNVNVNNFFLSRNTCSVSIIGFCTTSTSNHNYEVIYCNAIGFQYCNTIATATGIHGFHAWGSNMFIDSSQVSNKFSYACADTLSRIRVYNPTGSGNSYSFYASQGGIIHKRGTISVTSANGESVNDGSIIAPVSGVLNPWGDNTLSTRPAGHKSHVISQNLTANVATKLNFTGLTFDNLGNFDTNGKFTAPSTGMYKFTVSIQLVSISAGSAFLLQYYLNGAYTLRIGTLAISTSGAVGFPQIMGSFEARLGTGDTAEFYGTCSSAVSTNPEGSSSFISVTRIA